MTALLAEELDQIVALRLHSNRRGALLVVDGVIVGKEPLGKPLFLEPGEHVIEAHFRGRRAREIVQYKAGESRVLALVIVGDEPKMIQVVEKPLPWLSFLTISSIIATASGLGLSYSSAFELRRIHATTQRLTANRENYVCYRDDVTISAADCFDLAQARSAEQFYTGLLLTGATLAVAGSVLAPVGLYFSQKTRKAVEVSFAPGYVGLRGFF